MSIWIQNTGNSPAINPIVMNKLRNSLGNSAVTPAFTGGCVIPTPVNDSLDYKNFFENYCLKKK